MIVKDYQCRTCETVTEMFVDSADIPSEITCPACNGVSDKLLSIRSTTPIDASWVAGVREVVDKKSDKPHIKEFLRHPTRANLKTYMEKENLRHLDKGEPAFPKVDKKNQEAERARLKDKLIREQQKREALEI